jgi:hypothetical protein
VKLRIPAAARRSSATGRKCRAEFAEVLEVIGAEFGVSQHDGEITDPPEDDLELVPDSTLPVWVCAIVVLLGAIALWSFIILATVVAR